jgi:hypothetical protein
LYWDAEKEVFSYSYRYVTIIYQVTYYCTFLSCWLLRSGIQARSHIKYHKKRSSASADFKFRSPTQRALSKFRLELKFGVFDTLSQFYSSQSHIRTSSQH